MPGGGDPVGGVLQATDDGRGKLLPGAAKGTGVVQGVQGGDGGWIDVRAHEDTTQTCRKKRGLMCVRARTHAQPSKS